MRTLSLNDADLHQTHAHVAKNPRLTLLADQTDDGSRIFFFLRFAYLEAGTPDARSFGRVLSRYAINANTRR